MPPERIRFGPVEVSFDATVLRPRLWTLAQAEWAAELSAGEAMLELGCGAGQIGLAAAALSGGTLTQVDRDAHACRWAAYNAAVNDLQGLATQRCAPVDSWPTGPDRFSVVIADPPYVPSAEIGIYPDDPPSAIDGGPDGYDVTTEFLACAARALAPGGHIVLQARGREQASGIRRRLSQPSLAALHVEEIREFGPLRALLLLGAVVPVAAARRGGAGSTTTRPRF